LIGFTACLWEATARKPGNVHPFAAFSDTTYLDFVLSAAAMAPVLDDALFRGIGPTVLEAVRRTQKVVRRNTNLGIVLLLAPLAAVPPHSPLPLGIGAILDATTRMDSRCVYEAIRMARPGGLGTAEAEDIADEPSRPLRDVMRLAAERDAVARQYANGFREVFTIGLPAIQEGLQAGRGLEAAIILGFLRIMATCPDTLIGRKRGQAEAEEAARRAETVLQAGWPTGPSSHAFLNELDAWLRADGNHRNPGASADLVTASLYAALRDNTITLPLAVPWSMPDRE